jgi:hypothetical protein
MVATRFQEKSVGFAPPEERHWRVTNPKYFLPAAIRLRSAYFPFASRATFLIESRFLLAMSFGEILA